MKNFEVNRESRKDEFEIALEKIKKDFISEQCKSDKPIFIFAGGQPGSGKTAMIDTIKSDNENAKFLVIDLDTFRQYHPDFEEIKRNYKKDGVLLTNSFAFAIENEMIKYAIDNSINTINVTTLRNTDLIRKNIQERILANGFSIKTYIMAVAPEVSYYSSLLRFKEQQEDEDSIARFTSKKFHDEAYQGMNKTILMLQQYGFPIVVCKRSLQKDQPAQIIFRSQETNQSAMLNMVLEKTRNENYKTLENELKKNKINFQSGEDYALADYETLLQQIRSKEFEREVILCLLSLL